MIKKTTFLFLLAGFWLLTLNNSFAQVTAPSQVKWLTNIDEATAKAKAENKPILMVFAGSDWCKPCIMLRKEVWDYDVFKQYAQNNLILLELDFPRFKKNQLPKEQVKHNEALAAKYNKEGTFPLVVLTDAEGKVIAKTGYKAGGPEKYVTHLKTLLKK